MLTLPDGIEPPICSRTRQPYNTVSPARLLQILSHVTEFRCGVQQLVDLAQLCENKGLHLCFMLHPGNKYEFNSGESLNKRNTKLLFVELPENADDPCNTIAINIATMPGGVLHIEQAKLIELLGSFEKVDGYLTGHELSHATALAKCYPDVSTYYSEIKTFFEAICQQLTREAKDLLGAHEPLLIHLLREALFSKGEEARNVLGLGMGENFDRSNDFIVSEFDFLQEGTGGSYTRMPYAPLDTIKTSYPKVCMAFLTLIFKLKEQSIASSEAKIALEDPAMQSLKATLGEVKAVEQNMQTIQQQLAGVGYAICCIQGDGNDGFYAILEALNPSGGLMSPYRTVKQGNTQWQAAERLRQVIADDPGFDHLREMVTTPLGTEDQQMGFDALPAVARHLNRPLVVINTTPDAGHPMFTYYDQGGHHGLAADFQAALNANPTPLDNPPIVLLYRLGHWEAIVPQERVPLPDTLRSVPLEQRYRCNPCLVA
ncbi:MAG: hypothetical protein LBH52_01305 [Puniceicoccales bacterium]|jgi:hypothetical protein|nr:hypothetical protein [Puniceicoccales bacterium]